MLKPPAREQSLALSWHKAGAPPPRPEIAHRLDIAIGGQQLGAHLEAIRADDHVDRARRASAHSECLAVGNRARHQLEVELETRVGASAAPDPAREPSRPSALALLRAQRFQPVLRAAPTDLLRD
jgi:hypothetical protein